MKRVFLVFVLLAGLVVAPAMAQTFTGTRPQFFSFSYTIPIGFSLEISEIVTGQAHNFTVSFALMEHAEVGFDHITLRGDLGWETSAHLVRVQVNFLQFLGAAFGFGISENDGSVLSVGLTGNFFQARAPSGFTFAMGLRADYVTHLNHPEDLALGFLFVGLRMTVGI